MSRTTRESGRTGRVRAIGEDRHSADAGYLAAIAATLFISWLVLRSTGGVGVLATQFFCIPILLCAYRFGRWATFLASVAASVLSGPIMPDHFSHGFAVAQATSAWVGRGIGLVVLGQVLAFLFSSLRRQRDAARSSLYDPLTGLANRVLFHDRLGHALLRLERIPGVVGVLLLDLDNFKAVNDALGYGVGDELLAAFGDRLRAAARSSETIGRLSGDEFAIIIEGTDLAGSETTAERMLGLLADPFRASGAKTIELRVSIGVADTLDPRIPAARLLHRADLAMYAAKRAGKNCYKVFDPELMTIG
jgi:diguanylate cyclase (GGDEF)-like protein